MSALAMRQPYHAIRYGSLPLLILACRFLGVAAQAPATTPAPYSTGAPTPAPPAGAATCNCECHNDPADHVTWRAFDGAAHNDNSCQEDNPDAGFGYNDICCEGRGMYPCCDHNATAPTPAPPAGAATCNCECHNDP